MMDGIPQIFGSKVKRPTDSFKGFELTLKDLEYREKFLEKMCRTPS